MCGHSPRRFSWGGIAWLVGLAHVRRIGRRVSQVVLRTIDASGSMIPMGLLRKNRLNAASDRDTVPFVASDLGTSSSAAGKPVRSALLHVEPESPPRHQTA